MALLFRYFSQDLKTAGKGSTVDCRHYLLDPACSQQVQVETNKRTFGGSGVDCRKATALEPNTWLWHSQDWNHASIESNSSSICRTMTE
jgi:hypothetical protein